MTETHPLIARYLEKLNAALGDMPPVDRADVVQEIGQHIADAATAGRPLEDVLTSLGPAEQLARAYQVELLLNPKQASPSRLDRYLRIFGLVAIGSIPTFVILTILGTFCVAFTFSGIVVFFAGVMDAAGALPRWVQSDVQPWVAVALGPFLTILGLASGWGFVTYIRLTARLIRRVVPAR